MPICVPRFWQLAIVGFMMIAAMGVLAVLLSRNIAVPLGILKQKMDQLAKGDLSVEVPDDGRSDEIGWMIRAVQVFRENGIKMRRMQEEGAELAKRHAEQRQQEMTRLAQDFEFACWCHCH